jgi:hypothetical protein
MRFLFVRGEALLGGADRSFRQFGLLNIADWNTTEIWDLAHLLVARVICRTFQLDSKMIWALQSEIILTSVFLNLCI